MVICKNCDKEVHYNNRFYNNCPECGYEIKHICWDCGNEIDPKHPEAIESPFTHFHKCPSCNQYYKDENIEDMKKCISDSKEYLENNDWYKVFDESIYNQIEQLVIMLKADNGRKFFCPFGIATGKPRKDFRKFQLMLLKNKKEYVELFNKVFIFIKSRIIGTEFYAEDLKISIISNNENIILIDYFVCQGLLEKVSLNPAKYKIISYHIKECSFFNSKQRHKCLSCGKTIENNSLDSERCDCKIYKKGKEKGLYNKMHYEIKQSVCSCTKKIERYWENKRKEEALSYLDKVEVINGNDD